MSDLVFKNQMALSLHNEIFSPALSSLDVAIREMARKMMESGVSEGSATLKISLQLEDTDPVHALEILEDEELTRGQMLFSGHESIIPNVSYKASYVVPVKEEVSEKIGGSGYKIAYDDKSQRFYVGPRNVMNGQTSLFDCQEDEDDEET